MIGTSASLGLFEHNGVRRGGAAKRPTNGRMQSASVGQGRSAAVRDDQRVFQTAGRQPELDRQTKLEGVKRACFLVRRELQPQKVAASLRDGELLLPCEAMQRQRIGPASYAHDPVAGPAHHRKQDRRALVPDFWVFGPDKIDPARAPGHKLGAETVDLGAVAFMVGQENRFVHER